MKRFSLVVAFAILLSFVGRDARGTMQYTVTDLGTLPGGLASFGGGINDSGQVVGGCITSSGSSVAFLYSDGAMTDLGTLPGGSGSSAAGSYATGINASGQVVGCSSTSTSASHAFLYSNGTMTDLSTVLGGVTSQAMGINASGQVVGSSTEPSNGDLWATVWTNGAVTGLGIINSSATAINASGQVVGEYSSNIGCNHAFLCGIGTLTDLGTFGGPYSEAFGINAGGQVVGYAEIPIDEIACAFLYKNGVMSNLGTLGGEESYAYGINDSGQVVGDADTSTSGRHAFVYNNGTMVDLNSLIDPTSGWTLASARAINDSGQIVCDGENAAGQQDALLLTPVPEPSTLALLGVGAISLLGFAWRRRRGRVRCLSGAAVVVAMLIAGSTQAQVSSVFNMPTGETSLQCVTVGDPGNAADTTDYGSVGYTYQMGKYDVTNAQYAEFLTAKASSSDPYGLWNAYMSSYTEGGIDRSGSGPYTYFVKPGQENQPVDCVTWYEAVRFANWLTNGQQNGSTESGTYTITGSGPGWMVAVPSASQRAAWAAAGQIHWLLPSENEWYKAAYYKGGSTNAGYWNYPTQSDSPPTSQAPAGGSNSANFFDSTTGYALTGSTNYDSSQNYLTDVGAYPNSLSAYGTLDQGGDVFQWNEALIGSGYGVRGGSWNNGPSVLSRGTRSYSDPTDYGIGFRVASVAVPEPGSIILIVAGGLCLAAFAWRRRRV